MDPSKDPRSAVPKIVKISLPLAAKGRVPKRIVEERGAIAVVHPVGPLYNPVYFDLLPGPGLFRGGHWHRSKKETFYVICGSLRIEHVDLESGAAGVTDAREGDLVTIEPRCAHRLAAIEFCRVIEFSNTDVDYFEDTVDYSFENIPPD